MRAYPEAHHSPHNIILNHVTTYLVLSLRNFLSSFDTFQQRKKVEEFRFKSRKN